jgi:signal transduction histidine kinase
MIKGPGTLLSKVRHAPGETGASAVVNGNGTDDSSPPDMFSSARGGGQPPGDGAAPGSSSRRALKNWRLRSRLLLLVTIPTVTAVAGGGVFIASSVSSAMVDGRVLTLANLSGEITGLVQALQNEREDTVRFIVLGNGSSGVGGGGRGAPTSSSTVPEIGPELSLLGNDYAVTTGWANQVRTLAAGVGGSYSVLAQQDAQAAITAIDNLPALRQAATGTHLSAMVVIQEYESTIDALLAVESQIALGSSDSTLAGSVSVLGLVSSMKEEASEQQALLTSALGPDLISLGQFGANQDAALTDAVAEQQGDLNSFNTAATAAERQLFNSTVSSPNIVQAQAQEQQAISLASSGSQIATDPTVSDASSALSYEVNGMRSVEQQFASSVISRAGSLRDSAITSAVILSIAVALLLGIALVATTVVGRSMVGPLRRLRNGALEIAGDRLPAMVRRMSETDGEGIPAEVEPIDVDSTDEIGEVARAFDQVHREAIRLASNEAALRGNVNAMFVNLSRRSQSLVERQIRVITRLEQGEQDSKRLASLFQMDHLATRMRRNSENLLVLAGQELSRRWSRPVALVDVLRAAVSEIERYERVTLNVQVEVSVRKEAVSDVVHLVAELVENATSYSAADTPVTVSAYLPSSGGALVEITDQGVGMGESEMAHANWRLDNPPVVDVAVSRRMGLFVVARLAARHGIRVRLRPAPTGGLVALVWLPDETITPEKTSSGPLRSNRVGPRDRAVGADEFRDGEPQMPRREPLAGAPSVPSPGGPSPFSAPPLPQREPVAMADPGQQPFTGWGADSWATDGPGTGPAGAGGLAGPGTGPNAAGRAAAGPSGTGPNATSSLSGIGDRFRRTEMAGGPGRVSPDQEPGQGGMPRTGPMPTPPEAGAGAGPGTGPQSHAPGWAGDGGSAGWTTDTGPSGWAADNGPSGWSTDAVPAGWASDNGPSGWSTDGGPSGWASDSGPAGWGTDGGQASRGTDGSSAGWAEPASRGEVTVPPVSNVADNVRLPIFEAVESHWFRRGRQSIGRTEQASDSWSSPADDGWRAAEVVEAPAADGTTSAGLPKRVPQANLVPGTAAAAAAAGGGQPMPAPPAPPAPARSATEIGGRYASFQQGIRQGRAAVNGTNPDNGEATTS